MAIKLSIMLTLTQDQMTKLQRTADHCFINGYSSTHFARAIDNTACINGLDIPCIEGSEFYYFQKEPYMRSVLNQLGYDFSLFGVCRIA